VQKWAFKMKTPWLLVSNLEFNGIMLRVKYWCIKMLKVREVVITDVMTVEVSNI
jgi:hypothetical protein